MEIFDLSVKGVWEGERGTEREVGSTRSPPPTNMTFSSWPGLTLPCVSEISRL